MLRKQTLECQVNINMSTLVGGGGGGGGTVSGCPSPFSSKKRMSTLVC